MPRVEPIDLQEQFVHHRAYPRQWQRITHQPHDLGMARRGDILPLIAELFVEFFTWAQPRKLDANVLVGHKAGECDELPRKVNNLNRRPHIERKYFAASALSGALQDQ